MDVLKKQVSLDGASKFLFSLEDGNTIEALYMNDFSNSLTYKSTVCVSSQVGCQMNCLFCATAKQGFIRNLTVDEIVDQVEKFKNLNSPIKAVVFAGMGEPLLNYDNLRDAIFRIHDIWGTKNFEIATVGVVPVIYKLIEDFYDKDINIRLNLSLHASEDKARNKLIPYNLKYNILHVLEAAEKYAITFETKVRIRYMLLKGINDSDEDICRLTELLQGRPFKLVVSSYNDNNIENLYPTSRYELMSFYKKVNRLIESDIFYNFATDIQGGCGQLRQYKTS